MTEITTLALQGFNPINLTDEIIGKVKQDLEFKFFGVGFSLFIAGGALIVAVIASGPIAIGAVAVAIIAAITAATVAIGQIWVAKEMTDQRTGEIIKDTFEMFLEEKGAIENNPNLTRQEKDDKIAELTALFQQVFGALPDAKDDNGFSLSTIGIGVIALIAVFAVTR